MPAKVPVSGHSRWRTCRAFPSLQRLGALDEHHSFGSLCGKLAGCQIFDLDDIAYTQSGVRPCALLAAGAAGCLLVAERLPVCLLHCVPDSSLPQVARRTWPQPCLRLLQALRRWRCRRHHQSWAGRLRWLQHRVRARPGTPSGYHLRLTRCYYWQVHGKEWAA